MEKAWEREYKMMCDAVPQVLEEDEQGWLFSETIENLDDTLLKMKWKSNVPGSNAPERVIIGAIADVGNMGYNVSEAEKLIDEGLEYYKNNDMLGLNRVTWRIWNILNNAPKIEGHEYFSYAVYDTFEKYKNKINLDLTYDKVDKDSQDFLDRTYYGWLAQIVGGAIGTAIEGYVTEQIEKAFGDVNSYVRTPNTYNDDITYEIAFLAAAARKGRAVTSADIAEEWAALVPFGWSAEEWALKNIKSGIYPPESGYLNNPYREWIGAQMRGAVCGMVAPGNPVLAAEYAYKDGVVSHYNNGVLGEIFNAIMVSLSYVKKDVREIVELAVESYLPHDSEYYGVVKFALNNCKKCSDWRTAWEPVREKYKRYNWIHAYPNAASEVISLWFGNGDFDKTMNISSMIGYDVDCNAAQIATIIGIISKENAMDERWTKPIGDVLKTYLRKYKEISIRSLAQQTVDISKKM